MVRALNKLKVQTHNFAQEPMTITNILLIKHIPTYLVDFYLPKLLK